MLIKLFKYEMKSTQRILIPLFLAVFALSILTRISIMFSENIPLDNMVLNIGRVIFAVTIAATIMASIAMTLITMIQRFYKSLLGDEGYLMFTLPVKPKDHIFVKVLTSMIWTVLCIIIVFISLDIIFSNFNTSKTIFNSIGANIKNSFDEFGFMTIIYFIEFLVGWFFGFASSILMIYASISIGNLSNKHKILASFGTYIGFSTIIQIVGGILLMIGIGVTRDFFRLMDNVSAEIHIVFITMDIMAIIMAGIFYYITNRMLTRHLNIE